LLKQDRKPPPLPWGQESLKRERAEGIHGRELYREASNRLYVGIELFRVSKISENPSDPYVAVLQIIGAYYILLFPNNNKGIITVTKPPTIRNNKTNLLAPSNLPPDVTMTIIQTSLYGGNHAQQVGKIAL
jgi:hypothetical protein